MRLGQKFLLAFFAERTIIQLQLHKKPDDANDCGMMVLPVFTMNDMEEGTCMSKYGTAFEKLKRDYEQAASTDESLSRYSPVKKVRVLKSIHGVPSETLTDMHGTAIDGYSVEKTIHVDDETNTTDDDVLLLDTQHHPTRRYHNEGLTILRCGLMTCVALSEAMKLLGIRQIGRVGFIGNGKTNIQNADCIHDLFGVEDFVIRGSARDRAKHLDAFRAIAKHVTVDDTADCGILNACDVIVTCTSTCDPADQLSTKELSKPRILIALDTGYLLDESFRRECEAYSDDVEQLEAYYGEEFIFDHEHTHLKQLVEDTTVEKPRICVYMFGISFADAEVAEMLYRHDVAVPESAKQ